MDQKPAYLSKTLWTNVILAATGFFPPVQSFIASHPMVLAEAFAVANILLRVVTKDKLSFWS